MKRLMVSSSGRFSGEPAEAEAHHQQALELARAMGTARDEAHALAGLGRCAAAVGHTTRAQALARASPRGEARWS